MTEEEIQIYLDAGLTFSGLNSFGEEEFIGTKKEWEKADKMLQAHLLGEEKNNESN